MFLGAIHTNYLDATVKSLLINVAEDSGANFMES